MQQDEALFCPDADLTALAATITEDAEQGLLELAAALAAYPGDPRLHFLQGSVLAGQARYAEGIQAMRRAVDLAPGYDVARFQLGFLHLTSGDASAALQSWAPLRDLPSGSSLRWFVEGLTHLSQDAFAEAVAALQEGMRQADVIPEMAADMQKIVDALPDAGQASSDGEDAQAGQTSADHLLLQRYMFDDTRH